MDEIVFATAKAMVSEGIPFRGVLFAGLMIKNGKVSRSRVRVCTGRGWGEMCRAQNRGALCRTHDQKRQGEPQQQQPQGAGSVNE
jgi:hypothetical protein